MTWTRAKDIRLTALWEAGKTSTEIARMMGRSRGSIMGRVRRLGIQKNADKPKPIKTVSRPLGKVCQWIEGKPSSDDACKCGAPVVPQRAYCREHLARSMVGRIELGAG